MLKKTIRRLGALAMVLAMAVSVFAVSASAVDDGKSTSSNQDTFTFTKTINMDNATGANTPAGTYKFTITPGTTVDATEKTPEIKAGVALNDTEATKTVSFSYGDAATKNITVDFSAVTFETAGIYRYEISEMVEEADKNADMTYDTAPRYLDVYVVNGDNDDVKIAGYIMTTNIAAPTVDGSSYKYTEGTKSTGFTNSYKTYRLTLSKEVKGNMADMTKKFNFTIEFEGPAGASFTYDKQTITLDKDGKATVTGIELNNTTGSAVIAGIPSTVKYKITENIEAKEGYTTTYTVNNESAKSGTATETVTMGKEYNTVAFTNEKENTTPTGVIMTIAPYALMVVLAGAFAVVFLSRRNRAE